MRAIEYSALLLAVIVLVGCGGGNAYDGAAAGPGSAASAPGAPPSTTAGGGISTVSSGVPNQRFMSISVEKYALNWSIDGDTTRVNIRVADSAGNPVPAGTTVQFSTSGGQIQQSCSLTGVSNGSSTISSCSVDFETQDYRPVGGLVAIAAWLVGEEAYRDLNANGAYDVGEPFVDSGRLFRDDNADGLYTPTVDELNVGATLNGAPGIGTVPCVVDPAVPLNAYAVPLSVLNSCNGTWGASLVRASVYLPVSDPRYLNAAIVPPGDPFGNSGKLQVWTDFGTNPVAAPSGTTVTIKSKPVGCDVAISPSAVPISAVGPTFHSLTRVGATCAGGTVGIEVTFGTSVLLASAILP